jgi:hypothetical protein
LYSTIVNKTNKSPSFKILIYSGDSDGVCATIGTQNWIYSIAGIKIISLFQPWNYFDSNFGSQQAGFLTKFKGNIAFATIHNAGFFYCCPFFL